MPMGKQMNRNGNRKKKKKKNRFNRAFYALLDLLAKYLSCQVAASRPVK